MTPPFHPPQDAHEALLQRWSASAERSGRDFVLDGVIDPQRWAKAPRRVLLMLREPHADDGVVEDGDVRHSLREVWGGPRSKTWWTAAYWAYALQGMEAGRLPRFPDQGTAFAEAKEALLASAVVHVKKSSGGTWSDAAELERGLAQDGELLRSQVDIIDPQVVVCGNVWSLLRPLWPQARQVYDMVWVADGRVFLDFWHPANAFPNSMNYYALAALLQNSGALDALQPSGLA